MVLLVAWLQRGETSSPDVLARHEGEGSVRVLAGRVGIDMDGPLIALVEGDRLYYDAKVLHTTKNTHRGACSARWQLGNGNTGPIVLTHTPSRVRPTTREHRQL
jgi:Cupin domain